MSNSSVLIAGILDDHAEVSLHHMSMLLRLQQTLARTSGVKVAFEFFRHRNEALTYFKTNETIDYIVVVDAFTSANVEFLLSPPPHDFVVAAYPLRTLDWKRVESVLGDSIECTEDIDKVAVSYNFTLDDTKPSLCTHGTFLPVKKAQLKVFKLTRAGLKILLDAHPLTMLDDDGAVTVPGDDVLCAAWPGVVYVDLSTKCVNAGPYDFSGCVGHRQILR